MQGRGWGGSYIIRVGGNHRWRVEGELSSPLRRGRGWSLLTNLIRLVTTKEESDMWQVEKEGRGATRTIHRPPDPLLSDQFSHIFGES